MEKIMNVNFIENGIYSIPLEKGDEEKMMCRNIYHFRNLSLIKTIPLQTGNLKLDNKRFVKVLKKYIKIHKLEKINRIFHETAFSWIGSDMNKDRKIMNRYIAFYNIFNTGGNLEFSLLNESFGEVADYFIIATFNDNYRGIYTLRYFYDTKNSPIHNDVIYFVRKMQEYYFDKNKIH
jgi:hypothetical protein